MADYQDRQDIDYLLKTVDTLKYLIGYSDKKTVATLEDLEALSDKLNTLYYDKSQIYTKEEVDYLISHITPSTSVVTTVSLTSSSASVTYGSSITLTATVLDQNDAPMMNQTVTFYDGNNELDTNDTDSNGEVTLTVSTLNVATHSLTASCSDVISDSVSVTVNKITSTITLLGNSASIDYGNDVVLNGTLSVGSGKSVKIYNGSTLIDTVSTTTNGAFSKTISNLGVGSYTFKATYEGDSTHTSVTSSNVNITVNAVVSSISLTSDKSILSYSDSETATLSATVLDSSNNPVSGVTVTFYNGSTSMGTSNTNSNGVATKSYSSSNSGDVSFTAEVGSVTSTSITLADIYWYSSDGTKLTGTYTTGSDSSYSYVTSLGDNLGFPSPPSGNFEFSCKAYRPTTTSTRNLLIEFGVSKSDTLLCGWDSGSSSTTKNIRIYKRSGNSNTSIQNNTSPSYNNEEWTDFKISYIDGTVTLTIGGTSISTTFSTISRIGNYTTSASRIAELKIKEL